MILEIVEYPSEILKIKSELVTKIDKNIVDLINNMCETMWASRGAGLSAIQVGIPYRIFIVDEKITGTEKPVVFINPEIISKSNEKNKDDEGCLSFPGQFMKISRSKAIRIKAQDIEFKPFEFEVKDFLARVIQHEMEHLDGKTFIENSAAKKFGKWSR